MLLYEKTVNGVRHIYGTLGRIPADTDQPVIYKDNNGNVLTDVTYGNRFRDDKNQGMIREQDGKNVTVWIGNTMVIPPTGQVGPSTQSIAFTTAPTKTAYTTGEAIDMTGAVVTATYDDETTADVTAQCVFSPATVAVTDTAITATYNGKTATTPITVTDPVVLQSIAFTTEPTSKVYTEGDAISLAGAVVTATYSDSTTQVVTNNCTFVPANGTAATTDMTKITATYQGKTAEVAITVNARPTVEYHVYSGVKDAEPTDVTGLTATVKTATDLINNGFSINVVADSQYPTLAIDKELGVKLSVWLASGFNPDFTEVSATDQYIYYINGPGDPIDTEGATVTYSFVFAAV